MNTTKWWLMFLLSYVIGLCVLAFRFVQAGASARLYWHPAPLAAIRLQARDHADEAYGARS